MVEQNNWTVKKAQKSQAFLRLLLSGPSGSGKTYSSLEIGNGLLRDSPEKGMVVIDTERGSSQLYADKFNFETIEFDPPYSLERYVDCLEFVDNLGYGVVIVDSLSHAWMGKGGALEAVEAAQQSSRNKNQFQAWGEITPKFNKLIDTLLGMKSHLIVTLRSKTAYTIEEVRGKNVPKKVGMAPVFREGIEFEFTAALDLSTEKNMASSSKDRTRLFHGQDFVPSEKTGHVLLDWLSSGQDMESTQEVLHAEVKDRVAKANTVEELMGVWTTLERKIKASPQKDDLMALFTERKKELK